MRCLSVAGVQNSELSHYYVRWNGSTSYCSVIFFFKQKTAYEMRISDWSSDVCSSDLFLQGKLAISTAWGGGPDLFAALGISRALRLLARAEILSAPRALEWGLLDAVADDGQPLEAFVDAYVAGFSERTPAVMLARSE